MRNKKISLKAISVFLLSAIIVYGCQKELLPELEQKEAISSSSQLNAVPGEYMVIFTSEYANEIHNDYDHEMDLPGKQNVVKSKAAEAFKDNNISEVKIQKAYGIAITGCLAVLTPQEVNELKKDERVDYIEENLIYQLEQSINSDIKHHRPNHPNQNTDTATTPSEEIPWGVNRTGYEEYNTSSRGQRAWVLDTGIDLDHVDLNVSKDDSKSFMSWGSASGKKSAKDDNGHGTHVAGTIGAILGNNKGVVGVAAGVELVAVKVIGKNGSARLSDIISGIDYIASKARTDDVTNMSFGGGASLSLDQATINLASKGVFVSIAAGNSSDDASKYSPARTGDKHERIFTISAMAEGDKWASFSNYGLPPVKFIAPGVDVLSTWLGNGYRSLNGTSMSAPHVAGILLVKGSVLSDGNIVGADSKNYPVAHTGITNTLVYNPNIINFKSYTGFEVAQN